MDKIAVYCGTRNIYPDILVAARSLLYHNRMDRIYIIAEDDDVGEPLPPVFTVINMHQQPWFDPNGPNFNSPWSYMAYIRLALGKILPDTHRILYLDADTLVLDDLTDVFLTDMEGKLFAMVREDVNDITLEQIHAFTVYNDTITRFQSDGARPPYPVHPYYNSGVMLMNLDELRRTGADDAIIRDLNTNKRTYPDQDAINIMYHDKIVPLPQSCNVIPAISPDYPNEQIRIKHFASDKPVWKSSLWQRYRRMTWDDTKLNGKEN